MCDVVRESRARPSARIHVDLVLRYINRGGARVAGHAESVFAIIGGRLTRLAVFIFGSSVVCKRRRISSD